MAPVPPQLEELPQETIANIAERLPSDDLFALRLSCRKLQSKTFHGFANKFFTAKCIHFSTDSLKSLVCISESERLRPHLKELYISTKWFETVQELERYGHVDISKLPVELLEARQSYALDQKAILRNWGGERTQAEKMLTQALEKLQSVTTVYWLVDLSALPRHVDYRGRGRYVRHCNQNVSVTPETGTTPVIVQASLLMVLLKAVSKSGIAIRTFKVARSRPWHGLNMSQLSICVAIHKCFGESIRRNLTTLHLQLDPPNNSSQLKLSALQAFNTGSVFPNLRDLELDFSSTSDSVVWKFCRYVLLKLKLERLTNLSLRHATIKAETLTSVLKRCRKLTELKLEVTNLVGGQWVSILKDIMGIPELAHLHLMYLTEDGEKTYFFDQSTAFKDGAGKKKERGSSKQDTGAGYAKKGCATCYHLLLKQFIVHKSPTPNTEFSICLDSTDRIQKLVPVFIDSCHLLDEDTQELSGEDVMDSLVAPFDVMTEMMFGDQVFTGSSLVAAVHPNYLPGA